MQTFARLVVLCLMVMAVPTITGAQNVAGTAPPPVLSDEQLLHKYVWSTLGAPGVIGSGFVAGVEQWQHYPSEWGPGVSGYAKRWASAYAAAATGNTTKYAVARALHQDPSFVRCTCHGVGRRLRHALVSPFTARTRDGRTVLSLATVAGQVAEHVVPASTWYPEGRVMSDGVILALAGVVSKIGVDVTREFVSLPHLPKRP